MARRIPRSRSELSRQTAERADDLFQNRRRPDDIVGAHDSALEEPFQSGYYSFVKKASITEAKNKLSALIDGVQGGGSVLIVDRGRPVARLEPVNGLRPDDDSRLGRLVRHGAVRPARAAMPKALFATRPPRPKKGASGVRALLDDRRDAR